MRIKQTIVAAAIASGASALLLPREAAAQQIIVQHDATMGAISNITMVAGASIVFLMPRVYYNDPEATVGWKARWHVSMLAPAMTLTAVTLFVDGPIRSMIKSTRPGPGISCTLAETQVQEDNGCESFGGPSTQTFASWGATGFGTGLFLVDTFKYNDGRVSVGGLVGNIVVPLTLSVVTSVTRSMNTGSAFNSGPYESGGQNLAGALPGFFTGAILGVGYAFLQRPNCGYGNNVICW
jgi:hypothetical protein